MNSGSSASISSRRTLGGGRLGRLSCSQTSRSSCQSISPPFVRARRAPSSARVGHVLGSGLVDVGLERDLLAAAHALVGRDDDIGIRSRAMRSGERVR
ncbi:MAG: hypothetical protein U5K38_13740 [Woeseiaceae bacterium]|nr:hypothetical protein [Woeseiaceae bacterium]